MKCKEKCLDLLLGIFMAVDCQSDGPDPEPIRAGRSQSSIRSLTYYTNGVQSIRMIFVETPVFTEDIRKLMPDEMYAELQQHLARRPDDGDVIKDTGGVRKIRWNVPGSGKRGGARVIYFWRVSESQILMLLAYKKATKDDLTPAQKKALRKILEKW